MLLTLFRLTMIVPLLISAVCVEASPEKLSYVPSEENKAVAHSHRQDAAFLKEDAKSAHDEGSDLVQKRQLNRNSRFLNEQDPRIRHGNVNSMENRIPRSGGLAHKMAKDALQSPKMQEAMRKLARVPTSKGGLEGTMRLPVVFKGGSRLDDKRHQNGAKHKSRRKKKRKRHHRRLRHQHPGQLKRGPSKRTSNSKRDINGMGSSMIKRSQVVLDDKSRDRMTTSESRDKVTAVKVDDSDYIDFSSPLTTESHRIDISARLHGTEKMIDRLMQTTTKDPSKKAPGDQGLEYSDYYSDDEVLQDTAANKIPKQLAEPSAPNDRFVRQALNFTSYRGDSQIDRNVQPYYPDYDIRREGTRYYGNDTVNSLNDFQSYPTIERLPALNRNSRPLGVDEQPLLNYANNYGSVEYRNEKYDTPYPGNMAGVPEEPQPLDENVVPETRDNMDLPDSNKFNDEIGKQPAIEPQNPEQYSYMNQYETPQSLSPKELQNLNVNEPVEPQAPQFRGSNNYQPIEMSSPEGSNFDQSIGSQSQAESARIPSAKEENTEMRTQPSYSPLQLYGAQVEQQEEQGSKNFPLQSRYNFPTASVPSAMDQPLGKILESLGINVNGATNNFNQNLNPNEYMNRQMLPNPNTYERPMEHFLSPNYLKKINDDSSSYNEGSNAKGSEYKTSKNWNRNDNRDGYFRRQSFQNGDYNNFLYHMEDEKYPSQKTNISMAVHDTKDVANQILGTIMEELEELKEDRSRNSKREGSWSTAQAGVKLDMRVVNRTLTVTLSNITSQGLHEGLLNGTWNITGHAPFKRGSPFSLTATDSHTDSIAVFIGSCRVCQGIDTIAGVWSIARQPKDCKDLQVSTTVFNDIFRKTKLSSLKEKQGSNITAHTKHKKRKS